MGGGGRLHFCGAASALVAAVAMAAVPTAVAASAEPPSAASTTALIPEAARVPPSPPPALYPSAKAYVGHPWSEHNNVCHFYYAVTCVVQRRCLPAVGEPQHARGAALARTIKDYLRVGWGGGRPSCTFTAEEDAGLHEAVLQVSPLIDPACGRWSHHLGRPWSRGRGGDTAAALQVGGSAPLHDVAARPASSTASLSPAASSTSSSSLLPAASATGLLPARAALALDMSSFICCDGFDEYGTDPLDSPCCVVGCRVSAELFPFITLSECCDYLIRRSSGHVVYANRQMRNCV